MIDDEDLRMRHGFGGSVGLGDVPALVIVDFAVAFTDPRILGGGNIACAVAATVPLLAGARTRCWPIVHTRVTFRADGSDAGVITRKVPALLELTEDSPSARIVDELEPGRGELVISKQQPSAFFATELPAWLAARRVDTVVVAGCTTSGCVRATIVDALSHNLRPVVVSDCVGDRIVAAHEASLADMEQKYADLMAREDLLAHYGSPPRRP